jgi:Leucine-rich repeat (LRR) protein
VISDVVREVKLKVKPLIDCYETHGVRDIVSDSSLCVGGDGSGACFGDSGGGLFSFQDFEFRLRGITSASITDRDKNCDVNTPQVFTDVEKFKNWIEDFTKLNFNEIVFKCKDLSARFCFSYDLRIIEENSMIVQRNITLPNQVVEQFVASKQLIFYLPVNIGKIFPNLLLLEVDKCGLLKVDRRNFVDLPKLTDLFLTWNQFQNIPSETFYDLKNLVKIHLEGNQLEEIDSETFIHNKNLKNLILSHNKLQTLEGDLFRENQKLEYLHLNNNWLTFLGTNLLVYSKCITIVNFRFNICTDAYFSRPVPSTSNETLPSKFLDDLYDQCDYSY